MAPNAIPAIGKRLRAAALAAYALYEMLAWGDQSLWLCLCPGQQGKSDLKHLLRQFRKWYRRQLNFVINVLTYPAAGIAPRSPHHWVIGHEFGLFAGNPKYLFLWIALYRPDIHATWITGDRAVRNLLRKNGYRAHLRWTLGGIIAALRARVFISAHGIRSVNTRLSNGALFVSLWHGVGLKGIQFGYKGAGKPSARTIPPGRIARLRILPAVIRPDVLASTSDFTQKHFSSQFRLPEEDCPQLGYPRLDCAFDTALFGAAREIDTELGFVLNPGSFSEVCIYIPTFRDSHRPFLHDALPDMKALSDALSKRGSLLYVKPHPKTATEFVSQFFNIKLWPDEIEVSTYLHQFSVLITDYSSVLYDYLLVRDRGAILYTFDLDKYFKEDRQLLYPYDENVAGLRVHTFEELCAALREGRAGDPALFNSIERIRNKFWAGSKFPASETVVEYIGRRVGIKVKPNFP